MDATTPGSVTNWLQLLEQGDDDAGHQLWNRYFHQMVNLARRKLDQAVCRFADEEDVAIGAFDSFCRGLQAGRFPRMQDRGDLWGMLVVITFRKAIDHIEHQGRQKRGGTRRRAVNEKAILDELLSREPSPEVAAVMDEECDRLLDLLGDDDLRQLVLLKLEGHNNTESAEELGCARVTVQRMLKLIRKTWQPEMPR